MPFHIEILITPCHKKILQRILLKKTLEKLNLPHPKIMNEEIIPIPYAIKCPIPYNPSIAIENTIVDISIMISFDLIDEN